MVRAPPPAPPPRTDPPHRPGPLTPRYGVVAVDPGLSPLALRRADGSLWILPEDGAPRLLNSSLEAFVVYGEAAEEAAEHAADAVTEALLERFRVVDAAAVADENSCWHIAAEELGYGMSV
ncbi:SUKH-4 family immunity protein [Kitasatospora sp. NPDC048365]|uniref:SUKH-4 family immunity protein n=1 Tax=Kitasatospora sp. NPDC048365 TaxID=3364050 RepID=UPI0037165671